MDLSTKRITITGAHGFLGKHVVKEFLARGVPEENLFIPMPKHLDYRRFGDCMCATRKADILVHLAGNVGGIGYNREYPGTLFYENLMMGVQLLETARINSVEKFVTVGTVCAYPKHTRVPFREEDLWEGYPEETNAPYGLAKKMLLVQSQAYRQQYGLNAIYLVPVNLYGPEDHFEEKKSHVIPALIKKVADAKESNAKEIVCWGTGSASREFLYVEDAAKAIYLATERYDKSDPVNIGAGREITIAKLVTVICKIMKFNGAIKWDATKPDGQPRRCLDTSRAQEEFGFISEINFEEGLRKTIDWYLINKNPT